MATAVRFVKELVGKPTQPTQPAGSSGPYDTTAQDLLQDILGRLSTDPTSVTAEDARRLHEQFEATDERTARLISAIEGVGAAHDDIAATKGNYEAMKQSGHASLLTMAYDLNAAVDKNPDDVTSEVFKLTQGIASKMQRAVGNGNAPHPELESELQTEYAKIEPKVEQGTVTRAEADHLHSLEARAHGHTERGGLTSAAQSVAAKRERQASLSDGTINANRKGPTPVEQSHNAKEDNLHQVEVALRPKVTDEPEAVTKEDASLLQSREARAHGVVKKDSVAAEAQSLADKNNVENESVAVAVPN